MRLEITYADRVWIAAVYATSGQMLARGYGTTEEGARYDAACHFAKDDAFPAAPAPPDYLAMAQAHLEKWNRWPGSGCCDHLCPFTFLLPSYVASAPERRAALERIARFCGSRDAGHVVATDPDGGEVDATVAEDDTRKTQKPKAKARGRKV